jgi:hypothetical protein
MSLRSSSQGFVRSIRRSVSWYALKEYVGGALWVLPTAAAVVALAVGTACLRLRSALTRG